MFSLIMTILCSTSITLLLKHNDTRKGEPILLLAGNYFVAAIVSFILLLHDDQATISGASLWFGTLLGFLFVFSFFVFSKAVSVAGAALATVSSRLSVIIPILMSIIVFHELPNRYQLIGFVFAVITILLFYSSLKGRTGIPLRFSEVFYLLAVLLGIGCADFCMKIFQQWRPISEKPFFLTAIFASSFLYTAAITIYRKISINKNTVLFGLILGVPNIFSSFFLIGALTALPAIIVYPTINISIIVLTTIAAQLIWNERLNGYGVMALLAGILTIILLGI